MSIDRLIKALKDDDKDKINEEMRLMFEEKLERKIWKIYTSMEHDLPLEIKLKGKDE